LKFVWQIKVESICDRRVRIAFHLSSCTRLFVLDFLSPRVASQIAGAVVGWARLRPFWFYFMILQEGTIPHALEFQKEGREHGRVTPAQSCICFPCRLSDRSSIDFCVKILEGHLHSF